jgi:hypothetical protein
MRLTLVVAALLCCFAATSCADNNVGPPAGFVGYRIGADERHLVLVIETGPEDEVVRSGIVAEDHEMVTVNVTVRRYDDLQPAIAVRREVIVTLSDPLGAREVHTRAGQVLQLVTNPTPEPS